MQGLQGLQGFRAQEFGHLGLGFRVFFWLQMLRAPGSSGREGAVWDFGLSLQGACKGSLRGSIRGLGFRV